MSDAASASTSGSIAFQPAGPEHASLLYAWRQEPVAQKFNPFDPIDLSQLTLRLQRNSCDLDSRKSSKHRWMAFDAHTCVGTVSLQPSWRMGYAELGYQLGAAFHGRGLGTRVVRSFLAMVFDATDLHRVFATIHADNLASIRLVERLGFVREGMLREHYRIDGEYVNEFVYGLLRREWGG